jgi:hypothetical protein
VLEYTAIDASTADGIYAANAAASVESYAWGVVVGRITSTLVYNVPSVSVGA